ncbi:hypothetical protein [Sunxiuqinia dokdonensis]|uniref:hypothetical protein n=1 Tax=Sunxiuqinia dokdonensis TaxID=1409788 RepID=UPI00069FF602|nr:hypothetical protein [Sunxiuqinia dokdonensis]
MEWTEWIKFPDPREGEYLYAPWGYGIYQLRNIRTNELVLFGSGNHLAYRMSSLLPEPLGQGTRKNRLKREYVLENINDIQYRTLAFLSKHEMKSFEDGLRIKKNHLFDT